MTRKIAKGALSFVMILYFVFLSIIGLGDFLYPDTMGLFTGDQVEGVLCFSYEETSSDETVDTAALCQTTNEGKILAFGMIPIKSIRVNYYEKAEVVCGGELFGIRMETGGLLVTGIDKVETDAGTLCPGEEAGLKKGDILLKANGVELKNAAAFSKIIAKSEGTSLRLDLKRGSEAMTLFLNPANAADKSGYRAGLWVRDGAAGIGTMTFSDPETGGFAGLGHAVCDSETGIAFPFGSGTVCRAQIESISKGSEGAPGEIRGKLDKERIGCLTGNEGCGIYGTLDESARMNSATVPIGLKDSVKPGKASIWCTLDEDGKKEYEIEIEEIIGKDRESKNFVLHITDPELLEKTGGIVQGMSGSPIMQNGHLIGAVTHVLVGDPTRGYGIFIENMLSAMPE